jgi:protein-tyrosine phosphatase
MKRILFVCHGNICRSPMAEGMLRKFALDAGLEHALEVDSAGMSGEHEGEDMHPNTRKLLLARDAIFDHEARKIRPTDSSFDVILGATAYQVAQLKRLYPNTSVIPMLETGDVPDPWYGTYKDYEEVYAMLEPRLKLLLERWTKA